MKKADFYLVVVLLLFALLAFVVVRMAGSDTGEQVVIEKDGNVFKILSLHEDTRLSIPATKEDSVLVIKEGTCKMESAGCPDLICVKHKPISHKGESIICVPNKIVVYIK